MLEALDTSMNTDCRIIIKYLNLTYALHLIQIPKPLHLHLTILLFWALMLVDIFLMTMQRELSPLYHQQMRMLTLDIYIILVFKF